MKKWKYEEEEITSLEQVPEGAIGFIYLMTNVDGHFYIGKKSLYSTVTRPPLKGTRAKRKITKESKWLDYKSSNKVVKDWEDYEIVRQRRAIKGIPTAKDQCR